MNADSFLLAAPPGAPVLATERPDQAEVRALMGTLDALERSLYPESAQHLPGVAELQRPEVRLLVLRDASQGQALGCGAIRLREDCAELLRMVVQPQARGRGLGAALVAGLERQAVLAGRPLLRLETGVRQRAAIRLYERLGYRRCAPFAGARPSPFGVFMEKLLGA